MENQSKPSFYAIIPAHVRYCKELEPGAKLLYGEITALCSQEGYCWASNKYLASLYDVEIKTIQRWLASLKENKFIETEVEIGGFQTIRKIWISPEFKKFSTEGQKCREGKNIVVTPDDKNVLHINTRSNTENKDCLSAPPVGDDGGPNSVTKMDTAGRRIAFERDEIFRKAIATNQDWKTSEIQEAWNILVNYSGRVNDAMAFIEGTIKNVRKKNSLEKLHKQGEQCEKKATAQTTQMGTAPKPMTDEIREKLNKGQALAKKLFEEMRIDIPKQPSRN